jgi:hypothetical protein
MNLIPITPPKTLTLIINPSKPINQLKPINPINSINPIDPTNLSKPIKTTKPIKSTKPAKLKWLPVSYMTGGGNVVEGAAWNDDTYAPLTCTWYDNLVRIATIGEGSCFIHSVLKAMYPPYQENNDASTRLEMAAAVRRDLAWLLGNENPKYPGHSYWETSGQGSFPRMVMQQIINENLIEDIGVDYSLSGLQYLFNSLSYLGNEVYAYVADALNIDIYVLLATQVDLQPIFSSRRPEIIRDAIVIIGNTEHYEVLAVSIHDEFQTVFPPDDPFVTVLTEVFISDFSDIINAIPYDPDAVFINDILNTFTIDGTFTIPPVTYEIFPHEIDPFRKQLDRLLPQILPQKLDPEEL